MLKTIIGWPAPNKQNTGKIHGSALGADEVAATKEILGFDPNETLRGRREGARARPAGRRPGPRGARRVAEGVRRLGRRRTTRPQGSTTGWPSAHLPEGWDGGAAGVPGRREGHRHPGRVRQGAGGARAGAAGAVGRLGRPGREQQHHDEGRAVVHPGGVRHQGVPGQRVRPHPALRHPRARHGLDPERHRRARRHPPVRRHVPGLQRLHARRRPAVRADEAAGHLRVDARLHRPGRGRPDAPADRAPVRAARHRRPRRGPPGGRQRDRLGLARRAGAHRPADRARAEPAEPADRRPQQVRRAPRAPSRADTSCPRRPAASRR